jgi:CheY-like chemotaxis protein
MSLEKAGWSLWGVSSTSLAGNEPLVLVVEDDRDMLTYIHSCRRQDYQLLLAYNGREDLQLL